MGLDVELLAVGGYRPALRQHLEFPASCYDGTQTGATVLRFMYGAPFTSAVVELCECLGTPLTTSGQIDPVRADVPRLSTFPDRYRIRDNNNPLADFLALREAGFRFFLTSAVTWSEWQNLRPGWDRQDRMPLRAQILAVPPAAAQPNGAGIDAFSFSAALDGDLGDVFSRQLALLLGVEPWDFNRNLINRTPSAEDFLKLAPIVAEDEVLAHDLKLAAQEAASWLKKQRAAGFDIFFLPARMP